jgi:hypothetical protein
MNNSLRHRLPTLPRAGVDQQEVPGSWCGSNERLATARRLPQTVKFGFSEPSPVPMTGMQWEDRDLTAIAPDASAFLRPAQASFKEM